jgi:hypothetical protein
MALHSFYIFLLINFYLVQMPKEPTESLYIHKARPTISCQIAINVAGTTGRCNVSLMSNLVRPANLPLTVPRDPNEFFPIPMDMDMEVDVGDMDDMSSNESPMVLELPGICVVGIERAKHYINSVR